MLTSRSEIERKKKIFILEPAKCSHFWIRGSIVCDEKFGEY